MSTVDVRVLILVNQGPSMNGTAFAAAPLSLLDVAGMSPLERLAKRLRIRGEVPITAILEGKSEALQRSLFLPSDIEYLATTSDRFWRAAESAYHDLIQSGAGIVVVIRMGAYVEVDFEKLVQFHLERECRVSRVMRGSQALEIFCLSAFRRNDAASLFRSGLSRCRSESVPFLHDGYYNALADSGDFRQLAVDILTLKTAARPAGTETKPGIWIAPGALVEKGSRILAPAFIGHSARIHAGALITRCTTIERHGQVDCGTIVENSTVLPYACLGAGLDLAHSVVGMGRIANLRRNAVVEVADEKLLRQNLGGARQRLLSGLVKIPEVVRRALRGTSPEHEPDLHSALGEPSPARSVSPREATAREFSPNLAIARRYGDQ